MLQNTLPFTVKVLLYNAPALGHTFPVTTGADTVCSPPTPASPQPSPAGRGGCSLRTPAHLCQGPFPAANVPRALAPCKLKGAKGSCLRKQPSASDGQDAGENTSVPSLFGRKNTEACALPPPERPRGSGPPRPPRKPPTQPMGSPCPRLSHRSSHGIHVSGGLLPNRLAVLESWSRGPFLGESKLSRVAIGGVSSRDCPLGVLAHGFYRKRLNSPRTGVSCLKI